MKNSLDSIDLKDNRMDIARGKNWFFNLGPCDITWKYYCVRKKFSYCNKKVLVFLMSFEIGLIPKNSYHRDCRIPKRCSNGLYLKGMQNRGHTVKVWVYPSILQNKWAETLMSLTIIWATRTYYNFPEASDLISFGAHGTRGWQNYDNFSSTLKSVSFTT